MQAITNQGKQQRPFASRLFGWLLLLTACYMLVQVAFAVSAARVYLGNFRLVAAHAHLPWRVLPAIFGFVGSQILINVVFTAIVFLLAAGAGRALKLRREYTELLAFALWLNCTVLVLILNARFFPGSAFSDLMPRVSAVGAWAMGVALGILPALCMGAALRLRTVRLTAAVGIISVMTVMAVSYLSGRTGTLTGVSSTDRPNIILIGIDSLRPDYLGFNGAPLKTPHLDAFLSGAVTFSESLTPIARTYPAWVSILSSRYPIHSGIRTNLQDVSGHDFSKTLPAMLQNVGYHTVYATDETSFSNIDKSYGFDRLLTPPEGLSDFLLGRANDFPLSNLLVNTSIGRVLFPWSYANRSVYPLYQPKTFLSRLQAFLSEPRQKPLFLAVHFCLPHYPYLWSAQPQMKKISALHYRAAVQRVDRQFSDFLAMLGKAHLLDHALVVLLSDHGEGLEKPGDRITEADLFVGQKPVPHFYPVAAEREKVNTSGGHGTDVLGLTQYHTLLAVRPYGLFPVTARTVTGMVSLLDIQPTILDYLQIHQASDGVSLLGVLKGDQMTAPPSRNLFVESDFSPQAVRSVNPDKSKVLLAGARYFRIDPKTARVVVRDDMLKLILASKQFANYRGEWVVAVYPKSESKIATILVNLRTGEWTDNLALPFAGHSPARSMLHDLREFFHLKAT